jgi:type II secretory pathway predicted ATPase ExeA
MPDTIFDFFGLRENSFEINPDPRFIYLTEQTQATLAELAYALQARKGLILFTGEAGTGKTILLRRLLDWLGEQKMPTALVVNSRVDRDHLLDFILNDFGIPCASSLKSEKLLLLNRWLVERYRAGQLPVLMVDEAQGLSTAALEEIRLLLNFETPRHKLLQIVLAGQPELEENLKRYELRQLRQRITVRCKTASLSMEQTRGYIGQRLRVAGAGAQPIFEPEAITSVHAYCHGIPRVINVLCERALINCCADGAKTVSPSAIEQAARDCQLDGAESIANILNSGAYAYSGLSDIGSILDVVSRLAGVGQNPVPQSATSSRFPATPSGERPVNKYSSAQPDVPRIFTPSTQKPAKAKVPPAASHPPIPFRLSFDAVRSSALRIWRAWRESFVSEARVVWRQTRRLFRSAKAMRFPRRQAEAPSLSRSSNTNRPWGISPLRRWLREPLNDNRRKSVSASRPHTPRR